MNLTLATVRLPVLDLVYSRSTVTWLQKENQVQYNTSQKPVHGGAHSSQLMQDPFFVLTVTLQTRYQSKALGLGILRAGTRVTNSCSVARSSPTVAFQPS